jgi:hypothetical protein
MLPASSRWSAGRPCYRTRSVKTVHWLVACLGCFVFAAAAGLDAQESRAAGPSPADRLASDLLTTADESTRTRLLDEHPETSRDNLCTALLARGKASFKGGDTDAALAAFDATAKIAEAADLRRPLAEALYRIGVALDHRGELPWPSSRSSEPNA